VKIKRRYLSKKKFRKIYKFLIVENKLEKKMIKTKSDGVFYITIVATMIVVFALIIVLNNQKFNTGQASQVFEENTQDGYRCGPVCPEGFNIKEMECTIANNKCVGAVSCIDTNGKVKQGLCIFKRIE
jgi:hypothetical protein